MVLRWQYKNYCTSFLIFTNTATVKFSRYEYRCNRMPQKRLDSEMTYCVSSGTLTLYSLAHSLEFSINKKPWRLTKALMRDSVNHGQELAVIVYRALHGTAPRYLSDQLQYIADLPSRRRGRLCSSTSSLLDVRPLATCYCWRSLACYCRPATLEQSTCRRPVCPVTHNISPQTENLSISAIISRHCSLTASP